MWLASLLTHSCSRGGARLPIGRPDTFHVLPGEAPTSDGLGGERILDFEVVDVIDLSDLTSGALTFRGVEGFSGANQVRVVDRRDASGNGLQEAQVNLDGNTGTVELSVLVDTTGNVGLEAADLLL